MACPTSYAYRVEESECDLIRLDNARNKGVDVREEDTVKDVLTEGEGIVGVTFAWAGGQRQALSQHAFNWLLMS